MDFQSVVIDASHSRPVLVQFSSATCPPCKMIKSMIQEARDNRDDFSYVVIIATEANRHLFDQFGVRGVPDIRLFRDGQFIAKMKSIPDRWYVNKWLKEQLEATIK